MKLAFLFLGFLFFLSSCSKDEAGLPTQPSSTNTFLPERLPFPLTVGTWWKYKRADTTGSERNFFSLIYPPIIDSSIEIITVIGKTKLTDSVDAAILETKNITKNKLDTAYAFYYRSNFIVTSKYPVNINSYADNQYLNTYDMRFRLPLNDGKTIVPSNSQYNPVYDSLYIKKDTTAVVLNKFFANSTYTFEYTYSYGAFAQIHISDSFFKNNLGFVLWKASYNRGSHYGNDAPSWYVRRMVDYYIAP